MPWTDKTELPPSIRIADAALKPTERKVAETLLKDRAWAVESTAQGVADVVGVSRASVIRTAQQLGYVGFPQLRVALARELAEETTIGESDGTIASRVSVLASRLERSFALLDETVVAASVRLISDAERVLVCANGLSAPIGADLVQRLIGIGRLAEMHSDQVSQCMVARHLSSDDVCVVISGSGANIASLETAAAAQSAGARVIAITNFASSPIVQHADHVVHLPPTYDSFQDELLNTSRAAMMILNEQLVEMLVVLRGTHSAEARAHLLSIIGKTLSE